MLRRHVVVPVLLGALVLAAPAEAQKSKRRSRPAATVPASATAPAPAPAAPEAATAVQVPAQNAQAQAAPAAKSSRTDEMRSTRRLDLAVEGFAGGLFPLDRPSVQVPGVGTVEGSAPPLFRWGARASAPFLRLDKSAALEWVATLGVSNTGDSRELMGYTYSWSTLGLDVVPGLRARYEVLPRLSLTGEVGMGVQFTRTTIRMTFQGEETDGTAAGLFRLALGGQYAVNDRLGIFFEPVGLHAYVGEGRAAGWSLQAGFAYAL